ncbi:ATP-binding protein [bacterium]|nr:ATP-binding protein [bacterium]
MFNFLYIATAIYAIIGAPSVGKTSIINELKKDGEETIKEVATELIEECIAKGDCEPWLKDNFQPTIFKRQLQTEAKLLAKKPSRFFVDRGMLDNLVYLEINGRKDTKEYREIEKKLHELDVGNRYAAIFYIEPYNNKNFSLEKNPIRRESTKEALALGLKIKAAYEKYYPVISIPGEMTPKERANLIKQKIKALENVAA